MAKLIINGTAHELVEDVVTIGRAPDNAIHIDDASVSSRHAELRVAAATCVLRDLGSTNGTRVNGATITETQLRGGDRIRFGGVEARFESDAPAATQPLPEAQPATLAPAEVSARPVDFANASPFGARSRRQDNTIVAVLLVTGGAVLAWLATIVAVLLMHLPPQ